MSLRPSYASHPTDDARSSPSRPLSPHSPSSSPSDLPQPAANAPLRKRDDATPLFYRLYRHINTMLRDSKHPGQSQGGGSNLDDGPQTSSARSRFAKEGTILGQCSRIVSLLSLEIWLAMRAAVESWA